MGKTRNTGILTDAISLDESKNVTLANNVTAASFIKVGGTASQFLKANGSVDSNAYYLASNPSGYTTNTGTVTSVSMTTPTGLTVTGTPITTSGTLALTFTTGYSIPTTASQTNWNTAYSWGNHATAGYVPYTGATTTLNLGSNNLSTTGAVIGSTFTNSSSPVSSGNLVIQAADNVSVIVYSNTNNTQAFQVQNTTGTSVLSVNTVVNGINVVGTGTFSSTITGSSFIKSGGTASQFLKADGSVDSTSYYAASNPSGYTSNTGTVTSVSGTGTVSGLTLTGTVTGSGSLTLGGTLSLTSGNVTSALGYTPLSTTGTAANTSSISSAVGNSYVWTGTNQFQSNLGATSGGLSGPPLQAYSTGNNSAFFSFHKGGVYAVNMGLDSDNVLRIGGWSASANRFQMDMSGNLTMAGDITAYSDERVKENIVTVDNALHKVLALRGVYYNRTDSEDKRTKLGVIAQETLTVVPEVVSQDNDGMYNVSYGNFAGLFIEAFKEQQAQIESQAAQITQLMEIVKTMRGL